MSLVPESLIVPPASAATIEQLAEKTLRSAGVWGHLPTPVSSLIEAEDLTCEEQSESSLTSFLRSLNEGAREIARGALQKVRGIADLRERVVYIAAEPRDSRRVFVQAHELGHHKIPWHELSAYADDAMSLAPEVEELFDKEANQFAADILFQGSRFRERARSYSPSFEAIFALADQHGTSRHSTAWRYVQVQDEALALAMYYPGRFAVGADGLPVLRKGRVIATDKFVRAHMDLDLPPELGPEHPWAAARASSLTLLGETRLACGAKKVEFQWQGWWNQYRLFVLLRRKPRLSFVGSVLNRT